MRNCPPNPISFLYSCYQSEGKYWCKEKKTGMYRSKLEEQEWKTVRDPIRLHGARLIAEELADAAALDLLEAEVRAEMKASVEFAIAASYPAAEEVEKHVYA